jgi:Ca2+-binding RTX toxin-like protein
VSANGGVLTFVAASGESNNVQLVLVDQGAPGQFVGLETGGGALTVGAGCTPVGPDWLPVPAAGATRANCGNVTSANVSLGDMDDVARMGTRTTAQDPHVAAVLNGGPGHDALLGGPLTDSIDGGPGDDQIDGWQGSDALVGGIGDDTFSLDECSGSPCTPTTGSDTVNGGDGVDSASYNRDTGVTVTLDGNANDGAAGENDNVGTDIENLAGSREADVLTGSDQPNVIDGGGGDGGDAGDTLNGLGGSDTLRTNNPFRSTLNGGGGDDHLFSARTLNGGGGNDLLERWSGGNPVAATVTGGPGVDIVDYATWPPFQPVTITLDDVANDGTPGLGDNVASDVENVRGGGGADSLTGNAQDNRFDGGPGGDTIAGSGGTDTIDYSARGAVPADGSPVRVTLDGIADDGAAFDPNASGNAELDNIQPDVENVIGTPAGDVIAGSPAANRLHGGGGDDTLSGLGGADELTGGDGADVADYEERSASVTVTLNGSSTSGNADDGPAGARDAIADDVEDIWSGSGDDTLTGSSEDNVVDGGPGADEITGLGGSDAVDYSARDVPVAVWLDGSSDSGGPEDGPEGARDTVAIDVEDVFGGAGDDGLFGNGAANLLDGGEGADFLLGGPGSDVLVGGGGDFDVVSYEDRAAGVVVTLDGAAVSGNADDGAAGARDVVDRDIEGVFGGAGDDTLTGSGADNLLNGGPGADQLHGAGGFDVADYSERTSSVSVRLDGLPTSGNAEDGPQQARDRVFTDVEGIFSGSGGDDLMGSAAENLLDAGEGDDRIDSRDSSFDFAVCGPGADEARIDDLDEVDECERVTGPEPPPTPGPIPEPSLPPAALGAPPTRGDATVKVARKQRLRAVRSKGLVVRIDCPAACAATARLSVDRTTARRLGLSRSQRVTIGRGRVQLASAGSARLRVKLTSRARSTLADIRQVRMTLTVTLATTAGKQTVDQRLRLTRKGVTTLPAQSATADRSVARWETRVLTACRSLSGDVCRGR